jgi:hypothetical protein
MNIAVSSAEFALLRNLITYLVPHLLGRGIQSSLPSNRPSLSST